MSCAVAEYAAAPGKNKFPECRAKNATAAEGKWNTECRIQKTEWNTDSIPILFSEFSVLYARKSFAACKKLASGAAALNSICLVLLRAENNFFTK